MSTQYPTCCHVLSNGTLCQAPALKRKPFRYFHLRDRQRRDVLMQARQTAAGKLQDTDVFDTLDLPVLEDANAIQVAASTVFHALGMRLIRPRRASLMLYALQIAHSNLPGVRLQPRYDQLVVQKDPEPICAPRKSRGRTAARARPGGRTNRCLKGGPDPLPARTSQWICRKPAECGSGA